MSLELSQVFNLSRNVFIEACAGAGKTWLLSKRYAAIMDDFARQHAQNPQIPPRDASNILVITFTRKAAAEMSGRIYGDLNQLLNDQAIEFVPSGFGSHLRAANDQYKLHLRATFARNAISTIDSFCTQILREQAESLDIDPEFRIQDEADTQRMILETWERFLREKSQAKDPDLKLLLEDLSLHHINEYIKKLQSHSELLRAWLTHQATHSAEELVSEFKVKHALPELGTFLEQALSDLVVNLPVSTDMLDPGHSQYQTLLNLRAYLSDKDSDPYAHTLELFEYVRNVALTGTGDKYLSRVTVSANVWPKEWTGIIRERLKHFIHIVESTIPYEELAQNIPRLSDIRACRVQHHLAKFYLAYEEAVKQRLKRENILSFDEVIVKTHGLLSKPDIAAYYGKRFSHILFDEFQDTNDLRWDIVRLIAENGQGRMRDRGLFVVGDTKQSIYRFNQADVQVMNRTRTLLGDGGAEILLADETYRSSRQYVTQVINPLMESTFPGLEDKGELKLYETYFKPSQAAEQSPIPSELQDLARCTVNAVLADPESTLKAPDILRTATLTQEWEDWLKTNVPDPGEGPQIGILLRTFTHILDYIRIFTQFGLEFEVLSSKGLFAQQESFDIYHFLSVIVNPLDDLALVGLLRSPFFVLIDADIQALKEIAGATRKTGWCWQALRVQQAEIHETIRGWQKRSGREPLDRLLTNILAQDERQLAWISETGGRLRLENLKKLIHTIHSLSLDGLTQREILEYFKYQIQHGDAAQAELAGSAKIQILSIHKSKGLEFPVVILPGLHSTPRAETSGLYLGNMDDEWQVGLTIDGLHGSQQTWMYDRLKARTQKEELAEDKRLFYVAVTRAQFGISFVLKINPNRAPQSSTWWERYIQPVFDLPLDKEVLLNDPDELSRAWAFMSDEPNAFELLTEDALPQTNTDTENSRSIILKAPIPLSQASQYEEISPHTIMTWIDAQERAGADERQKGEDLGLETSALTFGRLLHRVMEMEWFDVAHYHVEIEQFFMDEGVSETELQLDFLTDLQACLQIYQKSQLAQILANIPQSKKLPELPVFGYLRNHSQVYKVSGIIDLLYFDGQDWIVLDYKTDRVLPHEPETQNYGYWFQIQTYLWMLKQLYGIEARGALYFNRFDTIISIDYDETGYFSKLDKLEQSRSLQPFLPAHTEPGTELKKIVSRLDQKEKTIVLEPTRDSCERLAQYLAKQSSHYPSLQIQTLNELRQSLEHSGRQLTPYLARLGVASILGPRRQWGIVNRLAEAFYKATLGETVVVEKEALYGEFLSWCNERNVMAGNAEWDFQMLGENVQVIVNGISATSPADYTFLQSLSNAVKTIFLNPLKQGVPESGFNMQIGDWMNQSKMPENPGKHNYVTSYGVQEEVELVAQRVIALLEQGTDSTEIQIAVSSMERYIPSIVRIFDEQGLSVRLSKREPVMERPVTQLAFALLQGRMRYRMSWDLAMSVWLHPLVARGGTDLSLRQQLDLEVRKLGITHLDDTLPELFATLDNSLGEALVKASKDLLKFVSESWRLPAEKSLIENAEWLLRTLRNFDFTLQLEPGSVASKAYTSLKNAIEALKKDWSTFLGSEGSLADLNRELREKLRRVEVSSTRQGFGLDVISFLDTLNQHSPYLFVLGMTESQFPVSPDSNPFLRQSKLNPWFLNLNLFRTWLNYPPGRIFFSAPERDAGGEALEISTFCQYLTKTPTDSRKIRSLAQQYQRASGKGLKNPDTLRQSRHNALLETPGKGRWYGDLGRLAGKPDVFLSASAFDDLIKCPQKYWFGRKLKLEAAETDIAARDEIEVGNLVHKVLERFGKAEGFLLVAKDLPAALRLLKEESEKYLLEAGVDPQADLIDSKWSELYFQHYEDPNRNLIAAILQQEQQTLLEFPVLGSHEQAFGNQDDPLSWPAHIIKNHEISLNLIGQIDRVFAAGQNVWATDYKTGKVDVKDTRDFWTSQMLFYYLILKTRYPEKNVVLTYEQLKGFKDKNFGFKGYVGDLDSDHPVLGTMTTRSRPTVAIGDTENWSMEKIRSETLNYAKALAKNEFPLTERDESQACAYCVYERICRKTALPR